MKIIIEHDCVDYDATHLFKGYTPLIDNLIEEAQRIAKANSCPLSELNIRFVDE